MAVNGILYILYCNETISSSPIGILHGMAQQRDVQEL